MSYEIHTSNYKTLCEPISAYCKASAKSFQQYDLFDTLFKPNTTDKDDIRVIELFAGVGGFRVGLERASLKYKTIWSNQWEPSTKRQDASMVYCERFGCEGHSNEDIATVATKDIPEADLLVGGFPCQDYSVATTLQRSGGIEGKKGVLWWQIHRILKEQPTPPKYLFLENVDRLLSSPANQRGRDFAIILASLADLGYTVEWRVINAAEYGMPQRRKRTYIAAYKEDSIVGKQIEDTQKWLLTDGLMARAFPLFPEISKESQFSIEGTLGEVSENFGKGMRQSPFGKVGIMRNREVTSFDALPKFEGKSLTLGHILLPDSEVPQEFYIDAEEVARWEYLKGSKSEERTNKATGYTYHYSEGKMAFPDALDKASRTIITGEGGNAPSRFKHVILTSDNRYRRLTPIELERLNMFPDNHTKGCTDMRRAFLMGNALVTGIVEKMGLSLLSLLHSKG